MNGRLTACDDVRAGRLADVVVDPVERRVTHVVVRPAHGANPARARHPDAGEGWDVGVEGDVPLASKGGRDA